MPDAYGHSLYSELIDEIVADSSLDADLASLGDDQFKVWILRAEERICSRVVIRDEWTLQLITGFDTYPFIENPRITGATSASPVVITTVSPHGLTVGTVIRIARVNGMNINGQFVVDTVPLVTTFTVKYQYNLSGASSTSPIQITTTLPHGFSTGNVITIAGVLGNTAANGAWTITVVDQYNFTLNTSVSNGTYAGSGTATKPTDGTGQAYVGGGRFWTLQQVPTHIRDVKLIRAFVNNFIQVINVSDYRFLTHLEAIDNILLLGQTSTYIYPVECMINRKDTEDYLRFYPTPVSPIEARMFCTIRINPNLYVDEPTSSPIHLTKEYDDIIRIFVRSRIYGYLKDRQEELRHLALFEKALAEEASKKARHIKTGINYT